MGIGDKISNKAEELAGKAKEAVGDATAPTSPAAMTSKPRRGRRHRCMIGARVRRPLPRPRLSGRVSNRCWPPCRRNNELAGS